MRRLIERTEFPRTRSSIGHDLKKLGLKKGMTVLVHSSLSSIGWVNGGAVAVIQALMDTVTEEGTIVMPSQSTELSDPAEWRYPPVPEEWWTQIRESMPAYHPQYTPVTGMGKIAEVFKTFPDVGRSSHPNYSFLAWGKERDEVINGHSLNFGLGEDSPLGKLYKEDSYVLQIGTGFETNTCFHLAEYRIKRKRIIKKGAPVIENGNRIWQEFADLELREDLFVDIGRAFKEDDRIRVGKIGSARAQFFSFHEAVDFAVEWFNLHDNITEYK